MVKIYDEPETPHERACKICNEPETPNEGARLRYLLSWKRPMKGRGDMFKIYDEPESLMRGCV